MTERAAFSRWLFFLPRRLAWHFMNPAASPVLAAWRVLMRRCAQERLGVTAGSLTFTTVLALVPLAVVALSLFTAFPSFERLRLALQEWLAGNLIPAGIAQSVLENLTAFAGKASQLGAAGLAVLVFTSLSLMLTIDHALGGIWRVPRPRPLGQRLLVYWAALTLGPLLLGASLAITSYVMSQSGAWLAWLPQKAGVARHAQQGAVAALRALQLLLPVGGLALLYHYVPNTAVLWRHALAGGAFAALGLAALRWGMGLYLAQAPSYSLIYGAFAAVPLLLLWMHLSWFIVLLGAVLAASLPLLQEAAGAARARLRCGQTPGWPFQLAAEALQQLAAARDTPAHGLTLMELAAALRADPLQLPPVLQALQELGWTGQLSAQGACPLPRYVLLADPARTPLAPLVERLLLAPPQAGAGAPLDASPDAPPALPALWRHWRALKLLDLLEPGRAAGKAAWAAKRHARGGAPGP